MNEIEIGVRRIWHYPLALIEVALVLIAIPLLLARDAVQALRGKAQLPAAMVVERECVLCGRRYVFFHDEQPECYACRHRQAL